MNPACVSRVTKFKTLRVYRLSRRNAGGQRVYRG